MMRLFSAVLACCATLAAAANAYRPLSRSGPGSLISWIVGLCASELPLQFASTQLAALAAVGRGAARPIRIATRIASVMSGLALLDQYRSGRHADVVLAKALDNSLGATRPLDSTAIFGEAAHLNKPGSRGLLCMARIDRQYVYTSDISYGPHGDANLLDIWRRPGLVPNRRAPVLIQVPGGAWTTGSKRGQAHPLMSHLSDVGWICVSINYRLGPRNTWPAQIVDVKRAIAWVKQNIDRFGGDPDFIAISGGSAGGHLAALAALADEDFGGDLEGADTHVQAAIPLYGVYDFTGVHAPLHPMMRPYVERNVMKRFAAADPGLFLDASPTSHVHPDAPPFFILHGSCDSFIPVQQARSFVRRLQRVSQQPVAFAELPHTQHGFDILGSARAAHTATAVEQFLAKIYADRHTTR